MARKRTWLDAFFGPWILRILGVEFPERPTLEVIGGAGVKASAVDDEASDATKLTLEASGKFPDATNGTTYGEPESSWHTTQTANATPTIVHTISAPIATWGDCFVTVTWEVTVSAATGGGNLARKATFRRNSGTLALVNQTDNGGAADLTIAASMTAGVADNDTIKLTGTGISTAVNWIISAHAQIAKEP